MSNTPSVPQGEFDSKGNWTPYQPITYPLFQWPYKPMAALKALLGWGGAIWPMNLFIVGIAYLSFYYLQPALEQCATFQFGWIATILLRNLLYMWVIYGSLHYILYIKKMHGQERKYTPNWPAKDSKRFKFRDQVKDNIFWTNVSGVPIWTAYEVIYLWAAANNKVPYLDWSEHPVWFVLMFVFIVLFRDIHFYLIHRLIHVGKLFTYIHSLHHRNNDVQPWSGMSMHPVEHLLYFSGTLLHFVIPSHPVHFLFHTAHLAIAPASGHTGFEGPLFGKKLPLGSYHHYLHHKYFNCNYGGGILPMDKWFGGFFDGKGKFTNPKKRPAKNT